MNTIYDIIIILKPIQLYLQSHFNTYIAFHLNKAWNFVISEMLVSYKMCIHKENVLSRLLCIRA